MNTTGGGNSREVNVKLRVAPETQAASKALMDLQNQMGRLDKATKETNKEMTRLRQGGSAGPGVPGGGGGGGGGRRETMSDTLASPLRWTEVASKLNLASQALTGFTRVLSVLADKSLNAQEKMYAALDAVPFIGGALSGLAQLGDKIAYAPEIERMERTAVKTSANSARRTIDRQRADQTRALDFESKGARWEADAMARNRMGDPRFMSPGFAMGGAMFGTPVPMTQAMQGAVEARLRAKADAEAAEQKFRYVKENEVGPLEVGYRKAEEELNRLRKQGPTPTGGWGPGRMIDYVATGGKGSGITPYDKKTFDTNIEGAEKNLEEQKARLQEAINKGRMTELEMLGKRMNLEKADLEIAKEKLRYLDAQRNKADSIRTAAGMMSGADLAGLTDDIKYAQKVGWKNLDADTRGRIAANPISSGWANEQALAAGKDNKDLVGLDQLMGGALRRADEESARYAEQVKAIAGKALQISFDETNFRRQVADALEDVMTKKVRIIREEADRRQAKVDEYERLGKVVGDAAAK